MLTLAATYTCSLSQQPIHVYSPNNSYVLTLSRRRMPRCSRYQQTISQHGYSLPINPYMHILSTTHICSLSQQFKHAHSLNNPYMFTLSRTHMCLLSRQPIGLLLLTIHRPTCSLSQQSLHLHAYSLNNSYMLTLSLIHTCSPSTYMFTLSTTHMPTSLLSQKLIRAHSLKNP